MSSRPDLSPMPSLMAHEQTPLIETVYVDYSEPRYRTFPHSTIRRFCSWTLGTVLVLAIIGLSYPYAAHFEDDRPTESVQLWRSMPQSWPQSTGKTYEDLQKIMLSTPDEDQARTWSKYYTSGQHLAGKNKSQALWTRDRWQENGVKSDLVAYDVYINYPLGHRLALIRQRKDDQEVKYECSLEEDVLEEDPTTNLTSRVPTFHGYSVSGNVTAPYVYVNFGTYRDYEDLREAGIDLKGKIALAKYGRNFRGLKVKRAQELGMLGVVMYSDPQEDGEVTEQNGYKAYPEGPARNPSAVQRGSTQFLSKFLCSIVLTCS